MLCIALFVLSDISAVTRTEILELNLEDGSEIECKGTEMCQDLS
jgi:hypothetical protein